MYYQHCPHLYNIPSPSNIGFPFMSKFMRNGIFAMPDILAKLCILFSSSDRRSNEKMRSNPLLDDISFPVKMS